MCPARQSRLNQCCVARQERRVYLPPEKAKVGVSVSNKPEVIPMEPNDHINPLQWQHALGVARQSCARIFRDGGTPVDALEAFGLSHGDASCDWKQAVETIAQALCAQPISRAA